jgi:hypothetical protein
VETPASVEQFVKGQYVVLKVSGDDLAYAQFKVRAADVEVTALQKAPCMLTRYGPGVYVLLEFCNTLDGVTITIQFV